MARRKTPTPLDVQKAIQEALEAQRRADRRAEARRKVAEYDQEQAASAFEQTERRRHPNRVPCARCGATAPVSGWTTAPGWSTDVCQTCRSPEAGPGTAGWQREQRSPEEVRSLLVCSHLGLPAMPSLHILAGRRGAPAWPYASEAAGGGTERPWGHVPPTVVAAWRKVGEEAVKRRTAGIGMWPPVGLLVDGKPADEYSRMLANARFELAIRAWNATPQRKRGPRPEAPVFADPTPEQLDRAEAEFVEAAYGRALAAEAAKQERIAAEAARVEKQRQKAALARQHRRQIADLEKKLRAELRAA